MKQQFLLLTAACLLSFASNAHVVKTYPPAQKNVNYILRLHLDHLDDHPLLLIYRAGGKQVVDSSYNREGEWLVFKGSLSGPVAAQCRVRNRNLDVNIRGDNFIPPPSLHVLLENGEVKVTGDANKLYLATVRGGENDLWAPIRKKEAGVTNADWTHLKAAVAAAQKGDSSLFNKEDHSLDSSIRNIVRLKKDFIRQHPDTYLSLYFLSELENDLAFTEMKALYAGLGEQNRSTELGRSIGGKLIALDATANGKQAIPINKKDVNDNPVNLASLKGKYVLLDFWGSWCVFCRRSHPHLKEVYSQYKDKGFEIVGIAYEQKKTLEENYKVMKEAIAQDGVPWLQVLNNDGIDSFDAVKAYGVDAFPTKILLDREGKIVGRYEGSENPDLDEKLKELMGSDTAPALKKGTYTLRVHLDHVDNHPVVMIYHTGVKQVVDSASSRDGDWLIFNGNISSPVVAHFLVRNRDLNINLKDKSFFPSPGLELVLQEGEIRIMGDANKIYMATVQGGENDLWTPIREKEAAVADANWLRLKTAVAAAQKGDSSLFNTEDHSQDSSLKAISLMQKDFIRQHPDAYLSLYFLSGLQNDLDYPEMKTLYAGLGENNRSTGLGKSLGEKIAALDATANGKEAIPINKKDINGHPVNLSTLKGKYVLLDFWGSWCGPCRNSHPHLKELYSQYKNNGFEIVGIAYEQRRTLEENYKALKEAIAQDGIPWIQVLNNDGEETFDAVKAYGVSAFPTKILLDREGRIIGRYVGGENEDFDKKIKALLSAPNHPQ